MSEYAAALQAGSVNGLLSWANGLLTLYHDGAEWCLGNSSATYVRAYANTFPMWGTVQHVRTHLRHGTRQVRACRVHG